MKIEFDTDTMGPREAEGLVALLLTLAPNISVGQRVTMSVGDISVSAPDLATLEAMGRDAQVGGQSHFDHSRVTGVPVPINEPEAPTDPNAIFAPPPTPVVAAAYPVVNVSASGIDGLVDDAGMRWDARIHATVAGGGGTLTQKGVWRAKKGVAADLVATVAAEQAGSPQPVAASPPPPPPAPPVPMPPSADTTAAAPPPPAAEPVTPQPGPAAPPPPAGSGQDAPPPASPPSPPTPPATANLFPVIMGKVVKLQNEKRLTPEDVTVALQSVGAASARDLNTDQTKIPAFEQMIDALTVPAA